MTDQPKWTKGPWAVERNKRTWGWVDVVGPSLGVGGPTQATDLTLADEVKRIAEAHLISAAPDMADVLAEVAASLHQTARDRDLSEGELAFMRRVDAALAKARGRA